MKKRTRILCIEDDRTHKLVMDSLLGTVAPDSERDWATNATQAVELLKHARAETGGNGARPYDLMITDIFLDGNVTGVDLWTMCQRLFPQMPILITSALPRSKFDEFNQLHPGIRHYLQKPLDLVASQRIIRQTLDQAASP